MAQAALVRALKLFGVVLGCRGHSERIYKLLRGLKRGMVLTCVLGTCVVRWEVGFCYLRGLAC